MDNDQAKKGPNFVFYAFILLLIGMGYFGVTHVASLFDKQERSERAIKRLGGTRYFLKMSPPDASITDADKSGAVDALMRRFELLGIKGGWAVHLGGDNFQIELPKLPVPFDIKSFTRSGRLSFQMAHPDYLDYANGEEAIVPGAELLPDAHEPGRTLLVRSKVEIEGYEVSRAWASNELDRWRIQIQLRKSGGEALFDLSTAHNTLNGTGLPFAIILDGRVLSSPVFNEPIAGGTAQISGVFTEAEAKNLASAMQNPLPFGFEVTGEEVIAPAP